MKFIQNELSIQIFFGVTGVLLTAQNRSFGWVATWTSITETTLVVVLVALEKNWHFLCHSTVVTVKFQQKFTFRLSYILAEITYFQRKNYPWNFEMYTLTLSVSFYLTDRWRLKKAHIIILWLVFETIVTKIFFYDP